jgi:3D (Asp-Asp-Asp) domain-containing protein
MMNHFKKALSAAVLTFAAALWMPAAEAAHNPHATSSGFVPPAPPRRSAMPDRRLPNLGRDKHGFTFYHPRQLNRVVRTTAYTHSESDHIGYGPKYAIGTYLKYGSRVRSAAADWSVYPLGTKFKIKGEPYTYVIDDYGSALVGTATIDIYQPNKRLMRQWGRRVVEIEVIEWGSSRLSMEKLSDRRGYKHCRQMYAALQEQSRHRNTAKRR